MAPDGPCQIHLKVGGQVKKFSLKLKTASAMHEEHEFWGGQ